MFAMSMSAARWLFHLFKPNLFRPNLFAPRLSTQSPETPQEPHDGDLGHIVPGWVERARVDHRARNRKRWILTTGMVGITAVLAIVIWFNWFSLPNPVRWFSGSPDTAATSASDAGQWSMLGYRTSLTGYVTDVPRQPSGNLAWSVDLGTSTRSAPLVTNGVVYAGGHFKVMALDADTGEPIWTVDTPGPMDHALTLSNNGLVYVGQTDHRMLALNRETGAVVWKFQANLPITASALVHDGIAYVTSASNRIYAIDAQSGEKLWQHRINGNVKTTPAAHDGDLFAADDEGNLHIIDAHSGRKRFRFRSSGSASGPPVVSDGLVYLASGGSLYAIDAGAKGLPGLFWVKRAWAQLWIWQVPLVPAPPAQRGEIWRFFPEERASQGVIASPAIADGVYFLGDGDGLFYARDGKTDQEHWRFTAGGPIISSPVVLGERVYFGARDGMLYALNRSDGTVVWKLDLRAPVELPVAFADGRLFIRTNDGMLHAVD